MKKIFFSLVLVCLCFSGFTQAKKTALTKTIELVLPEGRGARASSVAWHPGLKRYYAPVSGNAAHAMAIFDVNTKRISDDNLTALFDTRGFWYVPSAKTFHANGYDTEGWVSYKLDNKGIPVSTDILFFGMSQPAAQSVGSYNPKNNTVYFLDATSVVPYDEKTGEKKTSIAIYPGSQTKEEADDMIDEYYGDLPESYNNTSVVATGIPKAEFALLNYSQKQIELYDEKTGLMTKILTLPDNAPAEDMLCFSYANGIWWLYAKERRIWMGYK